MPKVTGTVQLGFIKHFRDTYNLYQKIAILMRLINIFVRKRLIKRY